MSIPLKDSALAAYSTNVDARLAASGASVYGLSPELVARYAAAHAAYLGAFTAMTLARAAGDWSESQTAAKNATRDVLIGCARQVYATVQADGRVRDPDKVLLGVHVRSAKRTRIPPPVDQPALSVRAVRERTVSLGVDNGAGKRPAGAVAARVYRFVGPAYPADFAAWTFAGATSDGRLDVAFPADLPGGTRVWLCAAWVNRKQEPGPTGAPVTTVLQGGGTLPVRVAA
ncbi:MAG TPA: hypothetical protein VEA69_19760 [Tepidisphaeraceae bacterium]|nr:hypothetical protein [Tepidisphaeraceae bacterium]